MCDSLLSAIEAAAADVFSSSVFLTHQSSIRKRKERKGGRGITAKEGVCSQRGTHTSPSAILDATKKDRENGKKKIYLSVYACLVFSAVRYDDSRLSSLLSGAE